MSKKILLAITGGIAAYKTPELIRLLKKNGWDVHVMMTDNAKHFVTPLTLSTVSQNPIITDDSQWNAAASGNVMQHIQRDFNIILVAPATANTIAKLSYGMADNVVLSTVLAQQKGIPILIAPAMNVAMYENEITKENLAKLEKLTNFKILSTDFGEQACKEVGFGRLLQLEHLVLEVERCYYQAKNKNNQQLDIHWIITAGSTQEAIDPIRYISNHSSGKMAHAMTQSAWNTGGNVHWIGNHQSMKKEVIPYGATLHQTTSAVSMYEKVLNVIEKIKKIKEHQNNNNNIRIIFIGVAAVADWSVLPQEQKIKKPNLPILQWQENPDILAEISKQFPEIITIGFAAETQDLVHYATEKLHRKNIDLIFANDAKTAFGNDENTIIPILNNKHELIKAPTQITGTKSEIAMQMIELVLQLTKINI